MSEKSKLSTNPLGLFFNPKGNVISKMVLNGPVIHLNRDGNLLFYTEMEGKDSKNTFLSFTFQDENFKALCEKRLQSLLEERSEDISQL